MHGGLLVDQFLLGELLLLAVIDEENGTKKCTNGDQDAECKTSLGSTGHATASRGFSGCARGGRHSGSCEATDDSGACEGRADNTRR